MDRSFRLASHCVFKSEAYFKKWTSWRSFGLREFGVFGEVWWVINFNSLGSLRAMAIRGLPTPALCPLGGLPPNKNSSHLTHYVINYRWVCELTRRRYNGLTWMEWFFMRLFNHAKRHRVFNLIRSLTFTGVLHHETVYCLINGERVVWHGAR